MGNNQNKNGSFYDQSRKPSQIIDVQISDVYMADYQRKVNPQRVKDICDDFIQDRMRPIELSFRDGKLWCYDGQHRLEACKQRGCKTIQANVHYGLTYEDESFLFAVQHVNEQHNSKRDEWRALCEAGNRAPIAQTVNRVCNEWKFQMGGDTKDGKSIGAIREVLKIAERHGERGLRDVLFVLRSSFQYDPSVAHHDLVAGLCKILDTYPNLGDYEFNRFVTMLKKSSPQILLREAMTERGRGGKQVARTIVTKYNRGLPHDSKKRLNEYLLH